MFNIPNSDHPIDGARHSGPFPDARRRGRVSSAPTCHSRACVVENYQGRQVHDPYRWLEQAEAPAVEQWIDAQNLRLSPK